MLQRHFIYVNTVLWKQEVCVMLEQFFTFKCFYEVLLIVEWTELSFSFNKDHFLMCK